MKRSAYLGRSFAAILLTAFASPAIFAWGFAAVGLVQSGKRSPTSIIEFVSAIWALGWVITLGCALVIGLCIEWPKSYWLLKRPSGKWWTSLLISVVAAEILLHGLFLAATRGSTGSDLTGGLAFFTAAAAVGGTCSAAFWWWLVVWPGRRFALRMQHQDGRLCRSVVTTAKPEPSSIYTPKCLYRRR